MSDELLPYYNRELGYLRELASAFAEANPKIAGHLRISNDAIDDPHVARLMEGVAFLNARVARKLDDEFPELVDSLLGVLYPHYLAPIPSMATVQFIGTSEMAGPQVIPADSELDTANLDGESCRFRTRYPVTLWPIALAEATMGGRTVIAPVNPAAEGAVATLRLSLRCTTPDATFADLQPQQLRFFLRGQSSQIHVLHQLILNNTVSIALADSPNDPAPVIVPPSAVKPVGFEADEALLPYPPQARNAYRILTDFFVFPEKFLYFEIDLLEKMVRGASTQLHIVFYFDRTDVALERAVGKDMFALGCTPVVNLFRQRAEPVIIGQNRFEHRVIADARRQEALEVYAVNSVVATDDQGRRREVLPFFARNRHPERQARPSYWTAMRRRSDGRTDATEIFLSFTGLEQEIGGGEWTASIETLCSNGDVPASLPYGGGQPQLALRDRVGAVSEVHCISPPTPTLRNIGGEGRRWNLISHLTLNHLSLTETGALDALKDILRLYDFRGSLETQRIIDGITLLKTRRGIARAPLRPGDVTWGDAMCGGVDISVELDPSNFTGSGLYLFALVLEHFFGLYASINSFTRLTASVKGQPGILHKWPARAGDRHIL